MTAPRVIEAIDVATFPMRFRTVVRHASAVRRATENVVVTARAANGVSGVGEGCPRSYVTGEFVASAAAFIGEVAPLVCNNVRRVDDLRSYVETSRERIDAAPAAWCAVELAV
ncbi:MAG: hypothetical protein KDB21_21175, partial [Acidimicrobiales bacterium]|nr:hypothetical protein [Acidimicrobiales bacterium]